MDTPQPIPLPSLAPQQIAADALETLLAQIAALSEYAGEEAAASAEAVNGPAVSPREAPLFTALSAIAHFARDGGSAVQIPDHLDAVRDALYSRALQRRCSRDPDGSAVDRRAAVLGYVLTVTRARHSLATGQRVSVRELAALGGVTSRQLLTLLGLDPEPGLRIEPLAARRWLRSMGVKGYGS